MTDTQPTVALPEEVPQDNAVGTYLEYKPTLWDRLGFGHAYARLEDEDYPEMAEAFLHIDSYVHFDWKDRLRILLSGKVMLAVATKTNVFVEKAISVSSVKVLSPTYSMRKQ